MRDAIFGKLGLPLRDIGEKSLKNIDRPVHIYQIQAPGTRARRDWLGASLRQYRRLAPALGLVVLLAALAGTGAWRFWPRETPGSDGMPTVAVLPFDGGEDSEQGDFARNLTREVSAVLSTFPGIHTVAVVDPAHARQSGATYALEGDVLKDGDTTRITARLIDTGTGENLWSDNYAFNGADRLALQTETARKIYAALGGSYGKILMSEVERAWRKPDRDRKSVV